LGDCPKRNRIKKDAADTASYEGNPTAQNIRRRWHGEVVNLDRAEKDGDDLVDGDYRNAAAGVASAIVPVKETRRIVASGF
jgi:hypothetical protein